MACNSNAALTIFYGMQFKSRFIFWHLKSSVLSTEYYKSALLWYIYIFFNGPYFIKK